ASAIPRRPTASSSSLPPSPTRSGMSSTRTGAPGRSTSKSGPSARNGEAMADLRIFSYLPNPRIWTATIAARLCGGDVEVRGAKPGELKDWLWDFDARPLSEADRGKAKTRAGRVGFKGGLLAKTDAFLAAHPFATVPAAFSPDGAIGVFESNSIMRAVARLGAAGNPKLYGADPYTASRIDSFLDASLVFPRHAHVYLLKPPSRHLPPP